MSQQIPIKPETKIVIELAGGDLSLVGWDNSEVLIKADEDKIHYQQSDDQFTLSCDGDLSLRVPNAADLLIQSVGGDAVIRSVMGKLEIDEIHGNLSLREVYSVSIGAIQSDFSLRGAQGDVYVKSVGGDASLRDVNGSLTIDSVADDLAVRGVGGNLKVDVDEDVVVHLDPKPGQEYSVVAGDDILLVLPPEANATLTLRGDEINVDWPGIQPEDSLSRVVTLGDGSAQIRLDAGGNLVITSRADAAETADEYGNFAGMMFDWGNWGREIGEHWGNYGRELGERMSRRAQEAAERAARKAEEAARRMERHAERRMRHGPHMRGKVEVGRWNWDFPSGRPVKPAAPVSDEERMTILRMLAEKKITAEEAEKLLSALEGGK